MDHGQEARRIVRMVHDGPRVELPVGDAFALAQVHALLHLADRVDHLAEVVAETAGT